MGRTRYAGLVSAIALAAAGGAGCGGDAKKPSSVTAGSSATTTATGPAPSPRPTGGRAGRRRRAAVEIRVPRDWHSPAKPVKRRNWPVPLTISASFPIHRISGNASCPYNVIRSFPPDGVYLLVAEFTKKRPPGVPPRGSLPPRGDLRHLDIRPSEVECFEDGLSGAKDFTENGRSFRVEILLGRRVSAERRRAALQALASLRIPPARQ